MPEVAMRAMVEMVKMEEMAMRGIVIYTGVEKEALEVLAVEVVVAQLADMAQSVVTEGRTGIMGPLEAGHHQWVVYTCWGVSK